MSDEELLDDLLLNWDDHFEQGHDLTPEELCPDRPDLVEPLRQRLAVLKRMKELAPSTSKIIDAPANESGDSRQRVTPPILDRLPPPARIETPKGRSTTLVLALALAGCLVLLAIFTPRALQRPSPSKPLPAILPPAVPLAGANQFAELFVPINRIESSGVVIVPPADARQRAALDAAAARWRLQDGDAARRADLAAALGTLYAAAGFPEPARLLLESARAAATQRGDVAHHLGWVHHQLGNTAQARSWYEQALNDRVEPEARSATLMLLAILRAESEDFTGAELAFTSAVELRREPPHTAAPLFRRAIVRLYQGRFADTAQEFADALEALHRTDVGGVAEIVTHLERGRLARDLPPLARGLLGLRGPKDSLRLLTVAQGMARDRLEPDHILIAMIQLELARTRGELDEPTEADGHFRDWLRRVRPLGLDHPHLTAGVRAFTRHLVQMGKGDEARALLRETLASAERSDREPQRAADARVLLAERLDSPDTRPQAEALLREALAVYRVESGPLRGIEVRAMRQLGELIGGKRAFELACELAARLAPLDLESRPRREFGAAAVELLQRARADQYPRWTDVHTDPRLDALRDRPDFQRLLVEPPPAN